MSLSPNASPSKISKRNYFLCRASRVSSFDFNLFCNILQEWESNTSLHSCLSLWENSTVFCNKPSFRSFYVLLFNVRGLDLRWNEVLLLSSSFKFDALILLETGVFDISSIQKTFSDFKYFFQEGENRNGSVLILIKEGISTKRVPCMIPNVCAIDIKGDEDFRLIGIYAPVSKSWSWDSLSSLLVNKCVIYGDFNVDIIQDGKKADALLQWTDENSLSYVLPKSPTSLRSDRIIDFGIVRGLNIDIQVYNGDSTSGHLPLLSVIPLKIFEESLG